MQNMLGASNRGGRHVILISTLLAVLLALSGQSPGANADLQATAVSTFLPDPIQAGSHPTNLAWSFRYNGPQPILSHTVVSEFFLSRNTVVGDSDDLRIGEDRYFHSFSFPVVGYSASRSISSFSGISEFTIPSSASGQYYVFVRMRHGSVRLIDLTPGNDYARSTDRITVHAPDTIKPVVTIVSPPAGARLTNALVTLHGMARDNLTVARVEYQLGNSPFRKANGSSSWAAQITLAPGRNTVRVKSVDWAGNESPVVTRSFILLVPLTILTNGIGKVTPNLDARYLEVGKRYTLTAMPGFGQMFSHWSGTFSTNRARLSFLMLPGLTLQANFVPNPFLPRKGNYCGLFYPAGAVQTDIATAQSEPEVTATNSGFFNLTLTGKGLASGKLVGGGQTYNFSGAQFDLQGLAHAQLRRRAPLPPLELDLKLDLADSLGTLRGSISDLGGTSAVLAFLTAPTTNWAGNYTFVIPGGKVDDPSTPSGDGAGNLKIDSKGVVKLTGKLAEGTAVSLSSGLSRAGRCALYASLQAGRGLVLGWAVVSSNEPAYDVLAQPLLWLKASDPGTRYYPDGFATQGQLLGARYQGPKAGQNIVNWTNGVVLLDGGNLRMTLSNQVQWANNKLSVLNNSNKLSLSLTAGSGLLSGMFMHPVLGKPVSFNGALLQGPGWGGGWFVGTNQSGYFRIQPEPSSGD